MRASTLYVHTRSSLPRIDSIKGCIGIPHHGFLTFSNDGTVQIRDEDANCSLSRTLVGHTYFVLDAAPILSAPETYVTVSEDRSLRIWRSLLIIFCVFSDLSVFTCVTDNTTHQAIYHPDIPRTVCVLDNGDIVTGQVDGTVYVWTQRTSSIASADVQTEFANSVAKHETNRQNVDGQPFQEYDRQPREALNTPGQMEGVKIIVSGQEGINPDICAWDSHAQRWVKIGSFS